jgi:hypothetical protein
MPDLSQSRSMRGRRPPLSPESREAILSTLPVRLIPDDEIIRLVQAALRAYDDGVRISDWGPLTKDAKRKVRSLKKHASKVVAKIEELEPEHVAALAYWLGRVFLEYPHDRVDFVHSGDDFRKVADILSSFAEVIEAAGDDGLDAALDHGNEKPATQSFLRHLTEAWVAATGNRPQIYFSGKCARGEALPFFRRVAQELDRRHRPDDSAIVSFVQKLSRK